MRYNLSPASCFPPAFDSEWSHHLACGSPLHAFSPCLSMVHRSMLIAWGMGAQRLAGERKTAMALHLLSGSDWPSALDVPKPVMEKCSQPLEHAQKSENISGGSAHCIERCCSSHEKLLLPDEWQLTSPSWAHFAVESFVYIKFWAQGFNWG